MSELPADAALGARVRHDGRVWEYEGRGTWRSGGDTIEYGEVLPGPDGEEREELELALRTMLDDDDAVTAAMIVVDLGWRPPGTPA